MCVCGLPRQTRLKSENKKMELAIPLNRVHLVKELFIYHMCTQNYA